MPCYSLLGQAGAGTCTLPAASQYSADKTAVGVWPTCRFSITGAAEVSTLLQQMVDVTPQIPLRPPVALGRADSLGAYSPRRISSAADRNGPGSPMSKLARSRKTVF